MNNFKETILAFQKDFALNIKAVTNNEELEQFRIAFLGRKSKISTITTQFESLPFEQKKELGSSLNELKNFCKTSYEAKKSSLSQLHTNTTSHTKSNFDITAHTVNKTFGSLHVYTHLIEQLEDIFISMGYTNIDGPELESEHYNFDALNIPHDHPARDAVDTFWLDIPQKLMRTHTSSIQIHTMEKNQLPLSLFSVGRVYRNEATDASHDFLFTQIEGLVIDKNISIAHLLGTVQTFLKNIFKKDDIKLRVRPGYFPFVEPGVEIDCSCPFCSHGCSVCKHTTWIELMGAGLVHPNVLHCTGIDSSVYSGFAFGIGLERIGMIIYGINDIRLFHSNTHPFLAQF
jgi:phenylalanyl-tRNA synthetase alpha chain